MMENEKLRLMSILAYTSKLLKRLHTRERFSFVLPVKSLNKELIYTLCDKYYPGLPDLNATMVISLKLALRLQSFCGSWILVKFVGPESLKRKSVHRWLHIVINPILNCDKCYVTKLLYHNLKEKCQSFKIDVELNSEFLISNVHFVSRIFSLLQSKVSLEVLLSSYRSSIVPRWASKVEVALCNSSRCKEDTNFDDLLNYHFQVPRYLVVEDTIAVPLESTSLSNNDTSQSIFLPKYLFFKVTSINDSKSANDCGYLASREHSSLYLNGSKVFKVPYMEYIMETLEGNIPPCLMEYYLKLSEVFEFYQLSSFYPNRQPAIPKPGEGIDVVVTNKDSNDCKTRNESFESQNSLFGSGHFLLLGSPGCGKGKIIQLLAEKYSYNIHWLDCWSLKGDTSASTEAKIKQAFSKVLPYSILVLSNVGCLSEDRDGNVDPRVMGTLKGEFVTLSRMEPVKPFVIGTSHNESNLSDEMWLSFTYQQTFSPVSLNERKLTITWLLTAFFKNDLNPNKKNIRVSEEVLKMISHRTAGFLYGDMVELIQRVYRLYAQDVNSGMIDDDVSWLSHTLSAILDEMQTQRSEALGLPRIPKVNWKEIGGLEEAKKELINTIQLPIKHPNLISSSLRRSGILLYGPPGTGKTLLAKSVASECGLNFLSVKGPELLNMYVGQSEENVRQVFEKAKSASPCVIFFDELDSLAPNRGRSGDSGGVMDRIVSALLAELDGVSSSSDVFVLAATNRPDLLEPALLRPGRFEKQIFLGICGTNEEQLKILKAVAAKIPMSPSASLSRIVEKLPFTYTGADFSALAVDAFYIAMRRVVNDIKAGLILEKEAKVTVCELDFETASKKLVPSVSEAELAAYKEMSSKRKWLLL